MHADDPLAQGGAHRATQHSGLATPCLRSAIHDLRGPLNTLSILHEVLRTGTPADAKPQHDVLAAAGKALRQLDGMLTRLREASASLAPARQAMPFAPLLAAASDAANAQCAGASPADLQVLGCPERLPALLQTLLRCCGAALADGGSLRLGARQDGAHARVEVQAIGSVTDLPNAHTFARLTADDPGPADWFALASRTAGLGAELEISQTGDGFSVIIRLPIPMPPTTRQDPSC